MKRICSFTFLPFLLLNCALFGNKKFSDNSFADMWAPELALLNQPLARHLPYLEVDLLKKYSDEMASIQRLWQQTPHSETDNKKLRKEENQFYYDHIHALNHDEFLPMPMPHHTYRDDAEKILKHISQDPTSSHHYIHGYASGDQIGFCFGRALMIHHALLIHGVRQDHIRKIFAIGDLNVGGQIWDYHVAIMIEDAQDGFLVLDPLQPRVMSYEAWVKDIQSYSIKTPLPRIRFYVTDPRKFLPASGPYSLAALSEQLVKDYFWKVGRSMSARASIAQ